ncbi:MAG: hypothetical protein R3C05_11650 [Pirellulaceae bacterium]
MSAAYAYRDNDRPLNVVLLSDGMTDAGEQSELLRLINSRPDGVRVFCVGVGNEVNRPLLDQMARQAGGLAAFVSTEESFARQAKLMRQKLVRPAIEGVTVSFEGAKVYDVEPLALGDLFFGTPLRLFGRYRTDEVVEATLRGQVQGAPWEQTVTLDFTKQESKNPEIERMWAQQRVSRLLGIEREGKGSQREEIVRLCEGYSIVSPHASLLVLENDNEYKRWKIEQRNALRVARDRAARDVVQQKLTELRRRSEQNFEVNRGEKLVSQPTAPASQTDSQAGGQPSNPNVQRQVPSAPMPQSSRRGIDLDFGGGGGGAIEPFTALLAIGAAGMGFVRRRKRG